jgi:hypothetical protein
LDLRKGEKELGCYVASMELEEEKLHDASWDLPLWRKGRVESLLLVPLVRRIRERMCVSACLLRAPL